MSLLYRRALVGSRYVIAPSGDIDLLGAVVKMSPSDGATRPTERKLPEDISVLRKIAHG